MLAEQLRAHGFAIAGKSSMQQPRAIFETLRAEIRNKLTSKFAKAPMSLAEDLELWTSIAALNEDPTKKVREFVGRGSVFELSFWIVRSLREELKRCLRQTMHSDIREYLGSGFWIVNAGFFVCPGNNVGPQVPHMDDAKLATANAIATATSSRNSVTGTRALTLVLALTESNAHIGGTRLWPGSHLLHKYSSKAIARYVKANRFVTPDLEPGAAALFEFGTVHAGGQNHTDQPRVLMFLVAHAEPELPDLNLLNLSVRQPLIPRETRSGRNPVKLSSKNLNPFPWRRCRSNFLSPFSRGGRGRGSLLPVLGHLKDLTDLKDLKDLQEQLRKKTSLVIPMCLNYGLARCARDVTTTTICSLDRACRGPSCESLAPGGWTKARF